MSLPKDYIIILGPIVAAIIAGGISFMITVLSKDQKTSEFRQAWIDSLRNETSEVLSLIHTMSAIIARKIDEGESESEILKYKFSKQDDVVKIYTLITKIKLRLNPVEHSKFIDMLNRLDDSAFSRTVEENEKDIHNIVAEVQSLLKKEWSRVKSGELSFKILKWCSVGLALLSSLSAALYLSNKIAIVIIP